MCSNFPDCTFQEVARYIREALPEEMKSKVPTKVSEKLAPAVMGPAPPLPVLYDVSPAEKLLGISFKSVEEQVKSMVQSMLENGFNSTEQSGLFKGITANYARFGPYCTFTFIFLEQLRLAWDRSFGV
eukprot:s2089_g13.t1